MTAEQRASCYAAFEAVGDAYEALEDEADIAAFDAAYGEILDEINTALEAQPNAIASYSGTCGSSLTWTYDSTTHTLTISGTGDMYNFTDNSDAPWYQYKSSIKEVTIEDGATSIGNYAFEGCSSLTSISIPESVTSIGSYAFSDCSNLTAVTIPEGVTSIKSHTFNGCDRLTSVTVPDSVTSIGESAFYDCSSLVSIAIPDNVTTIEFAAFAKCSSLTSITIPSGVTTISEDTFFKCYELASISIPNTVTSIGFQAFYGCGSLTSITIPDSVTSIGSQAFYECHDLTSIIIPEGVTSIESYTFYGCEGLTSVTIPNSVTSIKERAFCSCKNLTDVYYDGTMAERNEKLKISTDYNNNLIDATWHYRDSKYAVTYSWKGLPEGTVLYTANGTETNPALPTNSGTYVKGNTYTVDSTYSTGYTVYTHDKYGNINGKYTFSGWTDPNNGTMGDSDVTITGSWQYEEVAVPTYTVTWKNADGTVLEKDEKVTKGATPEYNGTTPTKAANAQYTYTFNGWTPEISAVTANVIYKATYTQTVNKYTITWKNEDGTELKSEQVDYGAVPSYSGETPTKTGDAEHSYTFSGWTPTVVAVTADAEYTATFTESTNTYTVIWQDWDETELGKDENVAYGTTPKYNGENPTRTGDDQYSYTFKAWSPAVDTVTGDITYTAVYEQTVNQYTITWKNEDGTELKSEQVAYGETPVYNGENPTKTDSTGHYTYTFKGWTPEITAVTGEATYTAEFDQTENTFTVTWLDADGTTVLEKDENVAWGSKPSFDGTTPTKAGDVQYTYTFKGWNPEITDGTTVTADVTYTAVYESTLKEYTVTYTDGVEGKAFANQEAKAFYGSDTPKFDGTPTRAGYIFSGWSPEVAETVTKSATYTATWKEDKNGNGKADEDETKYTVTYTDGVEGVEVFADKVTTGILSGTATPAFTGTPTRKGYVFSGWDSTVADTVTENATYIATWKEDKNGNGIADENETKYTVTYTDGVDGEEIFADLVTTDILFGSATPAFGDDPTREGYAFAGWTPEIAETVTGDITYTATWKAETIAVTRLYNPASGEHLLATSDTEISLLTANGWSVDGIMCYMPTSGTPVYRLYNHVSGEHLYTMNENEIANLLAGGDWTKDGLMCYSATEEPRTPIYRLYNSGAPAISSHLLSTSQEEMDNLTALGGWKIEGVALYAAK